MMNIFSHRHPQNFSLRRGGMLAILLLVLSGCGIFGGSSQQGAPDQGGEPSQNGAQVAPEIIDDEGYWRANTLPEPLAEREITFPASGKEASARLEILSLDSDGTSARLVGAWLAPVGGTHLSNRELGTTTGSNSGSTWARLIDAQASEMIEPYSSEMRNVPMEPNAPLKVEELDPSGDVYRTAKVAGSYAPKMVSNTASAPAEISLFYLDFPAPKNQTVSLQVGENAGVFDNVPLTQGQPFALPELTSVHLGYPAESDFPATYGAGAQGARKIPLDISTSSTSDASVSQRRDQSALNIDADVLFEFDKDTLNAGAKKTLNSVVTELKNSAAGQEVTIEGHTDDEGSDSYNQDLSERRAQAVKAEIEPQLSGTGITLKTVGHGETPPLVPNRDAKGNAIAKNQEKNRRVSFSYTPVQDLNADIDTGREITDLPKIQAQTHPEYLATGSVPNPKNAHTDEVDINVERLEEVNDFLKLTFSLQTTSGQDNDSAFRDNRSAKDENLTFGTNPWALNSAFPSAANMELWDKENRSIAQVVTAGPGNCFCSQTGWTTSSEGMWAKPTQFYAYFPKKGINSSTLTLRIANTAQLEFTRK